MAVHRAHLLSSSLTQGGPLALAPRLIVRELRQAQACPSPAPAAPPPPAPVRTRIWEFGVNLHCSILGTCLSAAELRHIVAKVDASAAAASDHEAHMRGVALAARREGGARLLQK